MDDPGMSIFQGNSLNVGDNENQEEAEDLEEQIRRREELQNLLINALDEFKYEDSTINSSTNISLVSADCPERAYRDVQTPYEQVKLLYDIRMKEIQALKEEFDHYKVNTVKEIDSLKRRLTLQEAETSQVEISLRNTKSLLVEKADIIVKQDRDLASKDEEIEKLKNIIKQLQYDVQAYNSSIEELQLKLTMDTGPFNVAARKFSAEELQSNHKEQIERLEKLLDEQKKRVEILVKEKSQTEDDLKRIIENASENEQLYNNTISLLNANIESAQNQCKDLLNLTEMLSKENEHYRGRIQKLEANEPILLTNSFKRKSLDYDTLVTHNERLKNMLLDKDVEVCTLKSKVKFYERDVQELLEYRDMKNKSLVNRECNKPEHGEKIVLIQNEMKILQQELIRKDQEISNLTLVNKELEDKIEHMIIQTRNDLENLSLKYRLPELETMNEELQNAEMKIKELQQKLVESEAETEELKSKMKKNDMNRLKLQLDEEEKKVAVLEEIVKNKQVSSELQTLIEENNRLKRELDELAREKEKITSEHDLLNKEYSQLTKQLKELNENKNEEQLTNSMLTLRADIEAFWHTYEMKTVEKEILEIKIASWINQINLNCIAINKLKESDSLQKKTIEDLNFNLKESEKEVEKLTEIIDQVNNLKILLEAEKSGLEIELKELKNELHQNNKELNDLRDVLKTSKNVDKNVTIQTLEDASQHLEEAKEELVMYQEELLEKCEIIKKYEIELNKLENEAKITKNSLQLSQKEVEQLQRTINELLEKETRKKTKEDGDKISPEDEDFYKAEILKAEVSIRDVLRKEYEHKIAKIEDTYRKIFETNQQKLNKYKDQENNYRHQLADLLSKYSQIISPIQKENDELKEHLGKIQTHHEELTKYVETTKKESSLLVEKTRKDAQKAIDSWKMWAKTFVQGCLGIEKLNAESRNTILNSLKEFDSQIDSIDKYFEEKNRQYKKKYNLSKM